MSAAKPRSWRTRALVALVVVVGARAGLALLFPWIVERGARSIGLTSEYEHASLSLLRGRLVVQGLRLHDRGADGEKTGEPVVTLDYLNADVAMLPLLVGRVRVQRLDVDGLEVRAARDANGRVDWVARLGLDLPAREPSAAERKEAIEAAFQRALEPAELAPPIAIDRLRVQRAVLRVRDDAVTPPFVAEVQCDVRLSDLGSETTPAKLDVVVRAPEWLGGLALEAQGAAGGAFAHATGSVTLDDLRFEALRAELAALGLEPDGKRADARLGFELAAAPSVREPYSSTNSHWAHVAHPELFDGSVKTRLALGDVAFEVDGEARAKLERIVLDADALSSALQLGVRADVANGELVLDRRADGAIAALGVRTLVAPPTSAQEAVATSDDAGSNRATNTGGAGAGGAGSASSSKANEGASELLRARTWILGRTTLSSLVLRWRDAATTPHAALEFALESAELAETAGEPEHLELRSTWRARAPGCSEAMNGELEATSSGRGGAVTCRVEGREITLAALAPYLASAELAPDLAHGRLTAALSTSIEPGANSGWSVSTELRELVLTDGERELASVRGLRCGPAAIDEDGARISVGGVALGALNVAVQRDAEERMHVLGVRTKRGAIAKDAGPKSSTPKVTAPNGTGLTALPRIELGPVSIDDARLTLVDESVTPRFELRDASARATLEPLVFGGAADGAPENVAMLRVELQAKPLLTQAVVVGNVRAKPGPLDVATHLELTAGLLDTRGLAPYFAGSAVAPVLAQGRTAATLDLAARATDGGLALDARVPTAWIADGEERLATLENAAVVGVLAADGWRGERAELAVKDLHASRAKDGTLRAFGVEIAPESATTNAQAEDATAPSRTPPGSALARGLDWPKLVLGNVAVRAEAAWRDDALATPFAQRVVLEARAPALAVGPGAPSSTWSVEVAAPDLARRIALQGQATLDPERFELTGALEADGLDGARASSYLAPDVACELASGSARVDFGASWVRSGPAAWTFGLALPRASVTSGSDARALLEVANGALDVNVAFSQDGELAALDVERARLAASVDAERDAKGAWHAFGLVVAPPPGAGASTTSDTPTTSAGSGAPTNASVSASDANARPPAPTPRAATPRPLITLGEFGVALSAHVRGLEPDGAPLEAKLALGTRAPLTLFDREPEKLPAGAFFVEGSAPPLVDQVAVETVLAPFADVPTLDVRAALRGLHGDGVTKLLPSLAAKLDGSALVDGVATAHARVEFVPPVRPPGAARVAFDLGRGFGARVTIDELALRETPDGRVLAGLESANATIDRFEPSTGALRVKSVELVKPTARFELGADGLRAFGFRFVPQAASTANAENTSNPATVANAPTTAASAACGPTGSKAALSIERFAVNGLDVVLTDTTTTPPTVLPLTGLEAEVKHFTSRALVEPTPITFHAFLEAGAVDVRKRAKSSSMLAGVLGATGKLITGQEDKAELERRPLFDELALKGRLTLAPKPTGWITLDVGALELAPFAGLARPSGVELGDGELDQALRLRFQGERGVTVESTSTFRELRLSEPADGPIARYLALPAPLDTVLYLLEDAEGAHRIPVSFHVGEAGLETGELVSAGTSAIGSMIGRAVASSPLRVLGGVGGILGIDLGGGEPAERTLRVEFEPGDAHLPAAVKEPLAALARDVMPDADRVLVLEATLGEEDRARAEKLANPPRTDVEAYVARLRQEKAELLRREQELAAAARVHWSVDRVAEARAAGDELRGLERELARLEASLDALGELLRVGAEKHQDARTRAAALEIANARLATLRAFLSETGVPIARIEVRRAKFDPQAGPGGALVSTKRRAAR